MKKSINEKEQCVQTDVMQSVILSELRIGNKIHFIICDKEDSKLDEYKEITVDITDFEFIRDNNSLFEAIELQHDILNRCGFTHNGFCYTNGDFKILKHLNKDYEFTLLYKDNKISSNIKYLHRLQNAVFVLEERELTVA